MSFPKYLDTRREVHRRSQKQHKDGQALGQENKKAVLVLIEAMGSTVIAAVIKSLSTSKKHKPSKFTG